MLNQNAKKWVEALRSGDYKQTRGKLRDADGFCCLGVACDLYASETKSVISWEKNLGGFSFDGEYLELPFEVSLWLGLQNNEGTYELDDYSAGLPSGSLINDNDAGESFENIASIIESEPSGLFVSEV